MSQSKHTKKALLASVLSVVVCLAMLIGSTFAWFTDSVTSGKNTIVAGNLDVELYQVKYQEDGTSTEAKVTDETVLFDENTQWEPGHAEVVYLRVANEGSLALNYKFSINAIDHAVGKNADGDLITLSDYLKFAVVDVTEPYENREAAIADADANSQPIKDGYSKEETLEKGEESGVMAVIVYMPTTVGNEANAVPRVNPFYPAAGDEFIMDYSSVELGVNLIATQAPVEEDSFGNDYDEFSEIETVEELQTAIADAEPGDVIRLSPFTELNGSITIPTDKDIVLDGSGATLKGSQALILVQGKATIKNMKFEGTVEGTQAIEANGDVTVDGCSTISGNIAHMVYINKTATNVVIKNCNASRPLVTTAEKSADCKVLIENNTLTTLFDVYGVSLSNNATNVTIKNNSSKFNALVGIKHESNTYDNVVFEGNECSANSIIAFVRDSDDTDEVVQAKKDSFRQAVTDGKVTGLKDTGSDQYVQQ